MTSSDDHDSLARAYLDDQLGEAAPKTLIPLGRFDDAPLEGEGSMSVFSFAASLGGNPAENYVVVAGETQPNYYPAWNLTPEDMFTLHLGTRFMLVMEIQQAPLEDLPATLQADLAEQFTRIAPGESLTGFAPQVAFRLEDHLHAVCRLRVAEEEVAVVTGQIPLGIFREIDLPPHVLYRLHLGRIIRAEADAS